MNTILKVSLLSTILMVFQLSLANTASAAWHLDNEGSSLSFVSIKNGTLVESHTFGSLTGSVKNDGAAEIQIDLTSTNTGIPIRDERMSAMLFETTLYPKATIKAKIDLKSILALENGRYLSVNLDAKLILHGVELPIELNLQVMRVSSGSFLVQSKKPVVINASSFGLEKGVEALRVIAGLSTITLGVPVSFSLIFHN
ncbi:MAG: YceI family protein [Pseudomonadales bacterium]|nr:YceI family protein [Pseudomonadales bacterium]